VLWLRRGRGGARNMKKMKSVSVGFIYSFIKDRKVIPFICGGVNGNYGGAEETV